MVSDSVRFQRLSMVLWLVKGIEPQAQRDLAASGQLTLADVASMVDACGANPATSWVLPYVYAEEIAEAREHAREEEERQAEEARAEHNARAFYAMLAKFRGGTPEDEAKRQALLAGGRA